MIGRGSIAFMLVAVPHLALLEACERKERPSAESGFVIGYNADGVIRVDLDGGNYKVLVPPREGHWWTWPAYDRKSSQVYFADDKTAALYRYDPALPGIQEVYRLEGCPRLEHLSVNPAGSAIALVARTGGNCQGWVIGFGKTLKVLLRTEDGVTDLLWADDQTIVGLQYRRVAEGRVAKTLEAWTVSNGAKRTIRDVSEVGNMVWVDVGEMGKSIVVVDGQPSGLQVSIYAVGNGELLASHRGDGLPGYAARALCMINERRMVVFREYDAMSPIGMFEVDLKRWEGGRCFTRKCIYGPRYCAPR